MAEARKSRAAPPGLLGGVVFFIVLAAGCGYIVFSKLHGFAAVQVTLVPVAVMVGYALLLGLARLFRVRDDQSGDNLYYMGFLFTLTSLGVSLYQYSSEGSAEKIVQNFGIAIASTIAGIALRIFFNQMRRDPVEVEQTARLELADASRKVKRELDRTVLEFGYFRRTIQQSIEDSLAEMKELLKEAKNNFVGQLGEFAEDSSKPIEEAARKSGTTIEVLSTRISISLDEVAVKLSDVAQVAFDETEREINALRHPGRRPNGSIRNEYPVHFDGYLREPLAELLRARPVRGRASAVQNPCFRQRERRDADRGDAPRR